MTKYVFDFTEGDKDQKDLLGGQGRKPGRASVGNRRHRRVIGAWFVWHQYTAQQGRVITLASA
jgi:hypothetical protein